MYKFEQSISNLADFLNIYPWDVNLLDGREPLDFFMEFNVDIPVIKLWDRMIDTSEVNRRLGLPLMKYDERNGRLFGLAHYAGIRTEWEELPWEWEYCKTISNVRIYSKGPAIYVRSRFLFYPKSYNNTKLIVYFGWIPRNFFGKIFVVIGMNQFKKGYGKLLKEFERENINSNNKNVKTDKAKSYSLQHQLKSTKDSYTDTTTEMKIRDIRMKLALEGMDSGLVDSLLSEILHGNEKDLYRIQIKKYAREWGVDFRDILKLALYSCKVGLLTLTWDLVCPHCRGVRNELKNLGDIPSEGNCDVCEIEFTTSSKNSIEVTFHVHPSIRSIQKRFFCAAEPATKKHIYFQKSVEPNDSYETNLHLETGVYRLRSGSNKNYSILDIQSEGESPNTINWNSSLDFGEDIQTQSGNLQLKLVNPEPIKKPFVIEIRNEDQYALRSGELLNFKEFKNIYSEEYIGLGITLDIGVQAILFTDIVGSTQLYSKYGDSKAFSEVRKHFVELYRMIGENNGVVVKTIGDSVLASFSDQGDSVQAGIDIQEFFQDTSNSDLLKVRISIHTGTCLAVNFNSGIDYFGNTVNYSAKLQRFANAGEIVISSDMFKLKQVKKLLKEVQKKHTIKRFRFENIWGDKGDDTAYKISIKEG